MKMRRTGFQVSVVLIVLGTLSLLNACGGGSSAPVSPPPQTAPSAPPAQPAPPPPSAPSAQPSAPSAPAAPPPAQTSPGTSTGKEISVTLKNGTFPKEIRVKVGEKVVFVVTNLGTVMHTFEFPDFDDMRYNEIKVGQTKRLEWVVPNKKGQWDMGCFLTEEGFHEGMQGTLIIE